jgi:hypothetical protein
MTKRSSARRNVGTGIVLGSGTLVLGVWSPVAVAVVLTVAVVLAVPVAVVVLTAARSGDRQKQRNAKAVLDSLLRVIRRGPFDL